MHTRELENEPTSRRVAQDGEFISPCIVIKDEIKLDGEIMMDQQAPSMIGQCVQNGQLMNAMSDGSLSPAIPQEVQCAADRGQAFHDQYVRDLSGAENVHGTPFEDRFPSSILDAQTPSEIDAAIQLLGSLQTIGIDVKRQMIQELKSRRANFELGKQIGHEQASSDNAYKEAAQSLADAWRT